LDPIVVVSNDTHLGPRLNAIPHVVAAAPES
jgi:hypothetical protein